MAKTVQHTNIRDLVEFKYVGGGGGITDQKPKKGLKKEFKSGGNYQCLCAVNVGGNYEINPLKIIKWGYFKDSKWSLAQNLTGRAILVPKKLRAPRKVSILCQDHLESLKWPH